MPQDFSCKNLRGRSFRGQNLDGADFSGADIRSTDFTCATLIGANFTNTQAGLQRRWVIGLLVCLWILVGFLGYFSSIASAVTLNLLTPNDLTLINLTSAINLLMTLAIFFVAIFRKGLVAFAVAFAIAFAFTVVGAAAGAIIVAGAGPVTGVEVVLVAVSFVVAFTLASIYPSLITLGRRKYKLKVELMHNGTHKAIHLTYEPFKAKLQ